MVDEGEHVPQRRLHLELKLDADSLGDAIAALRRIADDLHRDGSEHVYRISGRKPYGQELCLDVTDPEMSGSRYRAAVRSWMARRRD